MRVKAIKIIKAVLVLIIGSFIVRSYLPQEKSKINLIIVAITIGVLIIVSFVIQYFVSVNWREQMNKTIRQFSNK